MSGTDPLHNLRFEPKYRWWKGELRLPFFAHYGSQVKPAFQGQSPDTAYCMILDDSATGPSSAAIQTITTVARDHQVIAPTCLEWAFAFYSWRQNDEGFGDAPRVTQPDELEPHIRLRELFVHAQPDDQSDFGITFESSLDPEHGIGVRFRAGQPVSVGEQQIASEHWEWVRNELDVSGDGRTPWGRHQ